MSLFDKVLLGILVLGPDQVHSWRQATYKSETTESWSRIWGRPSGPSARQGHSLVLYNNSKVLLFGGRDNDNHRPHVPMTFEVKENYGETDIVSYATEPLSSLYDPETCEPKKEYCWLPSLNKTLTQALDQEDCSYSWQHILEARGAKDHQRRTEEECGFVPAGVFYNDVWVLDLDCGDVPLQQCKTERVWKVLHSGERRGGCRMEGDDWLCHIPGERWGHGAAMLNASTMLIYGGFSHECQDYCDDLWAFNLESMEWTQLYSTLTAKTKPNISITESPGARWKFSMLGGIMSAETGELMVAVFGGHRLWHGFASDNSVDNRWESRELLPEGGYLNDLWFYRASEPDLTSTTSTGEIKITGIWERRSGKQTCKPHPAASWESRNDILCTLLWPSGRSGHAAVVDNKRQGIWLFGGYTAYYPYPENNSPGNGPGAESLGKDGESPSKFDFFLDDLWFYNITTGYWREIIPVSLRNPERRSEHTLSLSEDILILHGGYYDKRFFNDTYYYFIETNRWLRKTEYVEADFPRGCIDDFEVIQHDPTCIKLTDPAKLVRSDKSTGAIRYQEVLPFKDQNGYTPDSKHSHYFGIVDDAELFVHEMREKYLEDKVRDEKGNLVWIQSDVPDGTPIAPAAATGPRQYARLRQVQYNQTTLLDVWEWCVTAKGEPTRDRLLDGRHGRGSDSIFLAQPKRKSPGWDGCRDLLWKHPQSRSGHASIFIDAPHHALLIYGGLGHVGEIDSSTYEWPTEETKVLDDLWTFGIFDCHKNCSQHGICLNGFCRCDPGYYGLDCSNITCPGTTCHYDQDQVQQCTHCCQDGHIHKDGDTYIGGVRKDQCRIIDDQYETLSFTGTSEGVCDGFGTCQCAPPFLGDDCSIKNCRHNCSFNGHCSLEYPVSRCICKDGYFGEHCQHVFCLNNCSYPNGFCDFSTGECGCNTSADPLGSDDRSETWHGEDCSFLEIWASGHRPKSVLGWLVITVAAVALNFY